jgi:hypothetical protein
VTFAWPGSPLDGQTYVVTDAQLEELEGVGLDSAGQILRAGQIAE